MGLVEFIELLVIGCLFLEGLYNLLYKHCKTLRFRGQYAMNRLGERGGDDLP